MNQPSTNKVGRNHLAKKDVLLRAQRPTRTWQARDFENPAPVKENRHHLELDFKDMLHRRLGWPLTRAEVAREELEVALSYRGSEHSDARGKHRPRQHCSLLPDPVLIDRHLAGMLGFLGLRAHRAATLALTLPLWLSFLVKLGLAQAASAAAVETALRQRLATLPHMLDRIVFDPTMQLELERSALSGTTT